MSYFVPSDLHHQESYNWIAEQLEQGNPLVIPSLALAEVGGAVFRISGDPKTGRAAVMWLLARPTLEVVSGEDVEEAAAFLACDLLMRGADTQYALVAYRMSMPLISWDEHQLIRSLEIVPVGRPGESIHWPRANM